MSEDVSPIDAHVGLRIRLRRVEQGYSIQDFAEAFSGVHRPISWQQLQKYERGVNRVTAGRLWELSDFLEVPVGYFFEGMGQDSRGNGVPATVLTRQTSKLLRLYDRMTPDQQAALRAVAQSMVGDKGEK